MVYITSDFTESVSIDLLIQDRKQPTDSTVQRKFTVLSWLKSKWNSRKLNSENLKQKRCNGLAF